MLNMLGRTGAPQKGSPTGQRISDSVRRLLACGPLYGVLRHLDVYLVQHDILWRLPDSESRISNQAIAAKLRTVVMLNSWLSFGTLMLENF